LSCNVRFGHQDLQAKILLPLPHPLDSGFQLKVNPQQAAN